MTTLDRKCIGGESNPSVPYGRGEFYHSTINTIKDGQIFWRAATNAKKRGNMDALNFKGAIKQFVRRYSSVLELSTADRVVSGSNMDAPCLLGIGVQ